MTEDSAEATSAAPPAGAGKVVVSYLNPGTVRSEFHECLVNLLVHDASGPQRILNGGGRLAIRASANLSGPRNQAVEMYLQHSDAEWFWFLDTDMTFAPDTLDRLLEHADAERAPIVGGLCFSIDSGRVFATLYDFAEVDGKPEVVRYDAYPPDAMMQVAATGTACLLIHRSVFLRMDAATHTTPHPAGFSTVFPWFQEREFIGKAVSEDITFCWRAGLLEIPIYVNTAVKLGHVKDYVITEPMFLAQFGAEVLADHTEALGKRIVANREDRRAAAKAARRG